MKLLIDADYIVYKCCASAETEIDFGEDLIVVTSNFSDVMKNIARELDRIKKEFFDPTLILFFSHHDNFRKKLYPDYKGHRNRKKPCGYKRAINVLKLEYEVILKIIEFTRYLSHILIRGYNNVTWIRRCINT